MSINKKIKIMESLIIEIAENLSYYQNENATEEEDNKYNEVDASLENLSDALYDFESAFQDFTGYIDADHEEFYFNNSYNGVSDRDFYEEVIK